MTGSILRKSLQLGKNLVHYDIKKGLVEAIPEIARTHNCRNVMIVGGTREKEPCRSFRYAEHLLMSSGVQVLPYHIENSQNWEPNLSTIMNGKHVVNRFHPDMIIACGSRVEFSVAKAISIFAASFEADHHYFDEYLYDGSRRPIFLDHNMLKNQLPVINIPTQITGGDEMNGCITFHDWNNEKYFSLYSKYPNYCIIDPELMYDEDNSKEVSMNTVLNMIFEMVSLISSNPIKNSDDLNAISNLLTDTFIASNKLAKNRNKSTIEINEQVMMLSSQFAQFQSKYDYYHHQDTLFPSVKQCFVDAVCTSVPVEKSHVTANLLYPMIAFEIGRLQTQSASRSSREKKILRRYVIIAKCFFNAYGISIPQNDDDDDNVDILNDFLRLYHDVMTKDFLTPALSFHKLIRDKKMFKHIAEKAITLYQTPFSFHEKVGPIEIERDDILAIMMHLMEADSKSQKT